MLARVLCHIQARQTRFAALIFVNGLGVAATTRNGDPSPWTAVALRAPFTHVRWDLVFAPRNECAMPNREANGKQI